MATNKRTASRNVEEPDAPPRRWGRALLWIGLIGVLVAGAVVVSVVFANEEEANKDALAEAPVDTEIFCQTASRFSSFDQIDIASGGSDQLRALSVVATQLETLSPAKIDDDFAAVSAALLNVANAVDALPGNDPAGVGVVSQKLDDELGAVSDQATQAGEYVTQWCGPLDSLGTSVPTLPDSTGG